MPAPANKTVLLFFNGLLAKRGLKIYKLPVKVLRRIRRRSRVQGSTA